MTLMDRRRALMENDVLWEWVPSKGLSNITVTASSGYTPSYELRSDCIRLKGPHATDLKQTNIVITNPPRIPSKVWFEVSVKNFPSTGSTNSAAACYLRGNLAGNIIYSYVCGAPSENSRNVLIRGANLNRQSISTIPTEFTQKLLVDTPNNIATAYLPGNIVLTDSLGAANYYPCIVSFEARSANYVDVTKIVIRRAKA